LKRRYISPRYAILLFAIFLQRGMSFLRTKGASSFRPAFPRLSWSSIILLNDCSLAKKYLVNVVKNTLRSTNFLSCTNVIVSAISCTSKLYIVNEPFCSTLESTMTYVFFKYFVSEPRLREARLILLSLLPRPTPPPAMCS
jgi:hypothetical protein